MSGPWSYSCLVTRLIPERRRVWLQSPYIPTPFPFPGSRCHIAGSPPPPVSALGLSAFASSTCCSGTCWDKSSASTSTCSFGWIGVSPAAPRTRVRETLASCPGPRDRLAGPAFCPAHRSWKRVWTHTPLLPDEKSLQSPGHSSHHSGESNDLEVRVMTDRWARKLCYVPLLHLSLASLGYRLPHGSHKEWSSLPRSQCWSLNPPWKDIALYTYLKTILLGREWNFLPKESGNFSMVSLISLKQMDIWLSKMRVFSLGVVQQPCHPQLSLAHLYSVSQNSPSTRTSAAFNTMALEAWG